MQWRFWRRWFRSAPRLQSIVDPIPRDSETQRHVHVTYAVLEHETDRETDEMVIRAMTDFTDAHRQRFFKHDDLLPGEGEEEYVGGQAWVRWWTEKTRRDR